MSASSAAAFLSAAERSPPGFGLHRPARRCLGDNEAAAILREGRERSGRPPDTCPHCGEPLEKPPADAPIMAGAQIKKSARSDRRGGRR